MYCPDCLQQKQANQNPFLSLILGGRGPTRPYLCDVKASFNKMPAILALREMLGLIHLLQLYASPIDKTILANGIV